MPIAQDFDNKVEKLLDKFHNARPDFIAQISDWQKDYRKAIIAANLQENAIIKEFASHLFGEIEGINYRLQNERSDKLPQGERDRLLDKRELYESFVYMFVNAAKKVESISKAVEENLK